MKGTESSRSLKQIVGWLLVLFGLVTMGFAIWLVLFFYTRNSFDWAQRFLLVILGGVLFTLGMMLKKDESLDKYSGD